MTITTVVLVDDAAKTITQVTDTVLKSVATTTVYKPGTPQANQNALITRATAAIADCDTAEALINANGWDGLTPAQRKAITLGIVQAIRAQARLNLNQFDSPS